MSLLSAFTSSPLKVVAMAGLLFTTPVIEKASAQALQIQDKILKIGDSNVHAIVYKNIARPSGLVFVSLHSNEQLLNPMLIENLVDKAGTIVVLSPPLDKGGNLCRWVRFSIDGQVFFFDPNRMWDDSRIKLGTEAGCADNTPPSMPRAGNQVDPTVVLRAKNAVISFRKTFASLLGFDGSSRPGYLVAAHNNRGLRFDSEEVFPDACFTRNSSKTSASDDSAAGDFFLVTSKKSFEYFASKDYNVILQTPATLSTEDCQDGSLSIFAQSLGVPFTTIEVNYSGDNDGERSTVKSQKKAASMVRSAFSAYSQHTGAGSQ